MVLQSRVDLKKEAAERIAKIIPNMPKPDEVVLYAERFGKGCKAALGVFSEGTSITIDRLNEFMGTPAGKATVFFIGWKLLAKDVMKFSKDIVEMTKGFGQTVLGLILLIPYGIFLKRMYQYFVTGKNVLVRKEGKTKHFEWQDPKAADLSCDAYGGWSFVTVVAAIVYTVLLGFLIF